MTALERLQKIDRTQQIDGWSVRLYFWSRSAKLLALFTLGTLCISLGLSWYFGNNSGSGAFGPLVSELARAQPDFDVTLASMVKGRTNSPIGHASAPMGEWIGESKLDEAEKIVALAFWKSLGGVFPQANAELLFHAHGVKPFRRANELVGDFHASEKQWDKALGYYERELRVDPAASTRAKILSVQIARRDLAELRRLATDPQFAAALTPSVRLMVAALEGRWGAMLAAAIAVERETIQRESLLLAFVAGLVWFIIAVQASEPSEAWKFRTLAPLLAVFAGAASTIPTLAVGAWQQEALGLRETAGFYGNLSFFILGVGPREELIKLLLFLPFVPLLLRRRNELEMLIVAACVGLGFAVAENLLYFSQHGPVVAYGRFLTANFLHMSATGLVGLAFCRLLQEPRRRMLLFLVTLALVMLAHGVYDAFVSMRTVRLFVVISISTFMALAFAFFQQLRVRRSGLTDQFSLSGTLVLGLALLTGLMLFCASRQLGLIVALVSLAASVVMLWLFASMLHWQLGEGMSAATHEKSAPPQYS